jgi:hypothetical protein
MGQPRQWRRATVVGTVAAVTVAHLRLVFSCLCAMSPLCIYKQREDGRWELSCV